MTAPPFAVEKNGVTSFSQLCFQVFIKTSDMLFECNFEFCVETDFRARI